MSDVFDRLVARATRRAPVLVARRPSRFESAAATLSPAEALPVSERHGGGDSAIAGVAADGVLLRSGEVGRSTPVDRRGRGSAGASLDEISSEASQAAASRRPRRTRSSAVTDSDASGGRDVEMGRRLLASDTQAARRTSTVTPPVEDAATLTSPAIAGGLSHSEAESVVGRAMRNLPATRQVATQTASATGPPRDAAGSRRESLSHNRAQATPLRTIDPETLLSHHLGPALVEAGALTEAEVARLVAVPASDRDRPRRDGRTPVAIDPVEVPTAAEVHLHIDHLEVRRPPAPQPPVPRAAREPAGSRPADHTAYLDRQRRRSGTGRP